MPAARRPQRLARRDTLGNEPVCDTKSTYIWALYPMCPVYVDAEAFKNEYVHIGFSQPLPL